MELIRILREARGLTRNEAAQRMGISVTALRQAEHPGANPKLSTLLAIRKVLGVGLNEWGD